MPFVYSPRPIGDYHLIGLETDEVNVISQTGIPGPLWNLFWLSNPGLDKIPEAGARWWRVYRPDATLLSTLIRDVYNDAALTSQVVEHPFVFLNWFEAQEHRDYLTYEAHGGRRWVDTVLQRSDEAATRIVTLSPSIKILGGKLRVVVPS